MTDEKKSRESRYPLRLPSELHEQIQKLAQNNFHSVNAEMVRLLRRAIEIEQQQEATGAQRQGD